MSRSTQDGEPTPEGVQSLLDTDLYKLTMQCAVHKHFPKAQVAYKYTNRTPDMKFNREAFDWLQAQISKLANLHITVEELAWLEKTCPYLHADYLAFLKDFKQRPAEHIHIKFVPVSDSDDTLGDIDLSITGLWVDTILYEIYLLALISESYFRFMDTDWNHDNQIENAEQKGLKFLEAGCVFSEFGSRRRRSYHTHDLVMQGLVKASKEGASQKLPGKLSGTSNVHMAMRYGVQPIGTVAHEWFMAIAALSDDYANANEAALQYWIETFGRGVLGIALTDTFGTPAFLRAFAQPAPPIEAKNNEPTLESEDKKATYAEVFTGVRQDSGDPLVFIKSIRDFYTKQNITSPKTVVFSDSLNVERCIEYKSATDKVGLTPSFGVGTFFTNDYKNNTTGEKSVPLNIVIKISEAEGRPAVKLSDDVGKNMGDDELVKRIKKEVGYTDRKWDAGDEAHRWDGK